MKVALYARYSSDNQRDASIADQLRVCRTHAEKQGWTIIEEYTDHAISGASLMRPGIQALIADAQRGRFAIVLAEAMDHVSFPFPACPSPPAPCREGDDCRWRRPAPRHSPAPYDDRSTGQQRTPPGRVPAVRRLARYRWPGRRVRGLARRSCLPLVASFPSKKGETSET